MTKLYQLGSYPSQERLSLQNAKDGPGKIERILPSMNFRVSFLRIHPKETQKSIDPTNAKCWKLQNNNLETRSLVAWLREFCRTVEIIARILREVVTRVRLCGQGPRRGCMSLWVVGERERESCLLLVGISSNLKIFAPL